MKSFKLILVLIASVVMTVHSANVTAGGKPVVLDPSYDHDRFHTQPQDVIRRFRAFTVSFDSLDDNDNDGQGEALGIPEWVAYQIKRYDGNCIPTKPRPRWFAEPGLINQGVAPRDNSYAYSRSWRNNHPDWYVRGHLAMKLIAARMGDDAEHNTHTLLNAVPQRNRFNGGIWLDLEYLTAAWAQRFGSVWVITGPVVIDGKPSGFIGEQGKGEFQVAIPDALFKIVVKEPEASDIPDVLALLYPQVGPGYTTKPYRHQNYLTSVDEIEALTGLNFLTTLPDNVEEYVERQVAGTIWEADPEDFIGACK